MCAHGVRVTVCACVDMCVCSICVCMETCVCMEMCVCTRGWVCVHAACRGRYMCMCATCTHGYACMHTHGSGCASAWSGVWLVRMQHGHTCIRVCVCASHMCAVHPCAQGAGSRRQGPLHLSGGPSQSRALRPAVACPDSAHSSGPRTQGATAMGHGWDGGKSTVAAPGCSTSLRFSF